MSRGRRAAVALALTGAAVVGAAGVLARAGDSEEPTPAAAVTTATVTRGDLAVVETVDGTLGYAGSRTVAIPAAGTVTWLPGTGRRVGRGESLGDVDGVPVRLLFGRVPMYRDLTVGSEGEDVRQLERNLRALGFGDGLGVDDEYTSWTAHQVRKWQEATGAEETGSLTTAAVVFLPGAQRVAAREVSVGARVQPGQPVLTTSRAQQVVTVALPVDRRDLARAGRRVGVVLPDGTRAPGWIDHVGTTVTQPTADDEDPTFQVVVRLRTAVRADLEAAPVQVLVVSERRRGVLSVPVAALLAGGAGRYAVEVVDGDGARRLPVELGMFADGRVEVTGTGLAAGQSVAVPA